VNGPAVELTSGVAPIRSQCIACHNPKKSESKLFIETFAQTGEGRPAGRRDHARAGRPDAAGSSSSCGDCAPRMPFKQEPLPPEQIALIAALGERGGEVRTALRRRGVDGRDPEADEGEQAMPEKYPFTIPVHRAGVTDGTEVARPVSPR